MTVECNVLFVGPTLSRKTLLVRCLQGSTDLTFGIPTIGDDNSISFKRGDKEICLHIRELGGVDEYVRYRLLSYQQWSHDVIVFFFDPVDRYHIALLLEVFFPEAKRFADPKRPNKKILLAHHFNTTGNIKDEVPRSEALSAASKLDATFVELFDHSAKSLAEFVDSIIKLAKPQELPENYPVSVYCKLLLEGLTSSGKEPLLTHLNGAKAPTVIDSIGAARCSLPRKWGGQEIQLELYDSSGRQQLHAILPKAFRNADAVVFVFDPVSRDSFESVLQFLPLSDKQADPHRPFRRILLANYFRSGEDIEYEVPRSEAVSAAFLFDATFLELHDHSAESLEHFLDVVVEVAMRETPETTEAPKVAPKKPAAGATGWKKFFRK